MQDSGDQAVLPLLLQLVEESAGIRLQAGDADTGFFELGLDSLFLTQFSVSLAKRFGVSLTFRQLSSEFGNLHKLAAFLDQATADSHSAPSAAASPLSRGTSPMPAAPVAARGGKGERSLQPMARDPMIQLFLSQIDVMQQQLGALNNAFGATSGGEAGTPRARVDAAADGVAKAPAASPAGRDAGTGPVLDAARPPVPGARLGRDPSGQPAWFVARADQPGKFVKLD